MLRDLPTLREGLSPWLAASLGLLLGAIGLGIYFRSSRDAFTAFLLGFVAFGVLYLLVGFIALLGAAAATGLLGLWRVWDSDARRSAAAEFDAETLEANLPEPVSS